MQLQLILNINNKTRYSNIWLKPRQYNQLHRYLKQWRIMLAHLNKRIDIYFKTNYAVTAYQFKTQFHSKQLTWKPYGHKKRQQACMARIRCLTHKQHCMGQFSMQTTTPTPHRVHFDSDSYDIFVDNCCSHTLTNDIKDYIEPPVKSTVKVRGYNGSTNSTMVGTVKWKIKDDKGKVHSFILPNTYYSPSVETRLLSPQHWAQTRKKGRDSYCITYPDAIIMRWNKDKYQITAPLDNRKHRNVGVVRSAPGIKDYLTVCQAIDQEYTTLAYPATICMDCQAAGVVSLLLCRESLSLLVCSRATVGVRTHSLRMLPSSRTG